jgi:hypothetical protein
MYALLFILMAMALLAAIKKWRKISIVIFLINYLLIIIIFIPHTIRHINISL